MRIVIATLALLLAFPAPAQKVDPSYSLDATGTIEIAPDGTVHSYKLDKGQKHLVEQALDKGVRSWRFEPVTVDGRPVIARTRMRVLLEAVPLPSGDYALKIAKVIFGQPGSRNKLRPPRYPMEAAQASLSARVLLVLKVDSQGNVERVHVEQTSLGARASNEKIAQGWRKRFEQASISAAKQWKFDISEYLGDEPAGTSVRVPVEYLIGRDTDNRWRGFIPGPRYPAPWVTTSAIADQSAGELANGELQPLDSRFRLKNDVVGTML